MCVCAMCVGKGPPALLLGRAEGEAIASRKKEYRIQKLMYTNIFYS